MPTNKRRESATPPSPTLLILLLSTAALLIQPPPTVSATSDALNDDVLGLIVFKSGLIDPTSSLSAWDEDAESPCGWPHVRCSDTTRRVTDLSLDNLGLSGRLPPRGLEKLSELETLSLSGNNLSGTLPPRLALLPSLQTLNLSHNALSGTIPPDLAGMPAVRVLDLSGNALSGSVPPELFQGQDSGASPLCGGLRQLDLSGNALEGPIPQTLGKCGFLLSLDLSRNRLSGSPDYDASFFPLTRLRTLDLSGNALLTGPLPDGISTLHNLKELRLGGNAFAGQVPGGIGLLPHLTALDLSHNSFMGDLPPSFRLMTSLTYLNASGNSFTGDLPDWVTQLPALQVLDLSRNTFTGGIPQGVGNLKSLTRLDLSNNRLTWSIPDRLSECGSLTQVHLHGNDLNGSIPSGLFDLGLQQLDLSSNSFSGPIPAGSTRLFETLRWLDLSNNHLTGDIPPEIALYFNLRYLNLSWNDLQSRLPPELGYFRDLSVLDLRNSALYGPIPGDLCDSDSLAVLQLDGNLLTGAIPDEIGNCSSLYLLSLSHNNLNGTIPPAMARLQRLKILNLEYNQLSGEIPPQMGVLDGLLAVNVSHNRLVGRLPGSRIFQSLDQSALQGNLGLCSPLVAEPCIMNVPKPLVLDPNAYFKNGNHGGGSTGNEDQGGGGSSSSGGAGTSSFSRHRRFLSVSVIVAISAAMVIVLGVVVVSLLNASARRRLVLIENALESMCSSTTSTKSTGPAVGRLVLFGPRGNLRPEDLSGGAEALLHKATEVGRGAFGTVYKAIVGVGSNASGGGKVMVAVKKLLTANIVQFHDEFDREVRILGRARHPNLMALRGYYWTPQLQLLLTDYAPGGSLYARLHEQRSAATVVAAVGSPPGSALPTPPPLTWAQRFKIALGTAKGLAHLHHSFRPPIVHYNLKPSNILLTGPSGDDPRVSDFGLARLLPNKQGVAGGSFSRLIQQQSALGFVAPEMACQSMRVNEKCDVYAYGVLVLELVTGRRAVEYGEDDVVVLVDQVRAALEAGTGGGCVDPALGESGSGFPEEEVLPVLKLGLVCASQIPSSRPTMAEVVQILQVIKTPVPERMEAF